MIYYMMLKTMKRYIIYNLFQFCTFLISKTSYKSKRKGNIDADTNQTIRECNELSTGIVLLADIMPSMIAKVILPFTPTLFKYFVWKILSETFHKILFYSIKIFISITFSIGSYIIVAYAKTEPIILAGVALTSLSIGIGESTLIGLTTYYDK